MRLKLIAKRPNDLMKKILVTGASGFIGQAVCNQAVLHGFTVSGAVRKYLKLPVSFEPVIIGEITDATDWGCAMNGVNVVIHLAARVHVMRDYEGDSLTAFRTVNVAGTLSLARQAAITGVKRFVFISSIGVNGPQTKIGQPFSEADQPLPQHEYALSKWEAEKGLLHIAKDTGMEVVIIRPPLVYGKSAPGNFGALISAVQRGLPLPLGAVHNQRSLVALDNLVDFILTCITHPKAANQTFLVSDGQDLSTPALVRGMAQAAGVPARLLPVPEWALQTGAYLLGKGDQVQRLCGNLQVDISKARILLRWVPPVSVVEALRRAMAV